MKTLGLFLGRFQPLLKDDIQFLENAAKEFDHVLVLIAGAGRPARVRAPLSWTAISGGLHREVSAQNWSVLPLLDTLYDDATWVSHVRICLDETYSSLGWTEAEVTVIGQTEANAKATLSLFPDWTIGKTRTRSDGLTSYYKANCPGLDKETRAQLLMTRSDLLDEQDRLEKASDVLGFPVVLNTADAVITQSNHLLVIEREDGLLSIPGTHIGNEETGFEAALRAAKNKAGIDMPKGALAGRLETRKVFDHPDRSERGRVRTEAFVFALPASGRMENVKPGKGFWIPFNACTPDKFFEDHYDICQALLRGISCDQRSLME